MRRLVISLLALQMALASLVGVIDAAFAQGREAIATKVAPIYLRPDGNLTPLRTAAVGTRFGIVGEAGDWINVEFTDPQYGRRVGWVRREHLRVDDPVLTPMDLSVPPPATAVAPATVPPSQGPAEQKATSLGRAPGSGGRIDNKDTAEPVTFSHQIRQFVMRGDDTEKVDMHATLTGTAILFVPTQKGKTPVTVEYNAITSMVYDRRSRVRKMFVGARGNVGGKATDHFLTVQYTRPDGGGDFIEVEMGKDTAPRLLATLEARSGKKVERSSGS